MKKYWNPLLLPYCYCCTVCHVKQLVTVSSVGAFKSRTAIRDVRNRLWLQTKYFVRYKKYRLRPILTAGYGFYYFYFYYSNF